MSKKLDNSPTQIGFVSHFACLNCGLAQTLPEMVRRHGTVYQNGCHECMGPLDIRYDEQAIGRFINAQSVKERYESGPNFWMLRELLPISEIKIHQDTPFTPLVPAPALAALIKERFGVGINLFLKLDMSNPTGSFKDRPVTLAFNKALEDGTYTKVITSSTGNLGISTIHAAKESGFGCLMFVPHTLGDVKIKAMDAYADTPSTRLVTKSDWGMANREDTVEEFAQEMLDSRRREVVRLEGTYDRANRFASEVAKRTNELSRERDGHRCVFIPNDIFRPYYKEGSKTCGYEIATQLKFEHNLPEGEKVHIIFPIGSGALAVSAIKGIEELRRLKVVDYDPVLWAAQPETCATVVDALLGGTDEIKPVRDPATLAKSIAIEDPGSGHQTLQVIRRTGGGGIKMTEQELVEAHLDLFETEGRFAQYVGGVVVSAVLKGVQSGDFKEGSVVVANITGRGLDRIEDDVVQAGERFQVQGRVEKLLDRIGRLSALRS